MTPEELTQKWQHVIDGSRHIFTWTEPHNLAFLAEHASKASCAVELGSYMGRTARVMLDAGCQHLWTVDNFQVPGTLECCQFFLQHYIRTGQCEIIKGDSGTAAAMLNHMRGKIDFVFVDDGHETHQVLADIRYMLPLLKSGAILCGHDFDVPHNDVAQGVIQSGIPFTVPVPRLWVYVHP